MSQELHYTSVPRGLKPGSRGFATVATSAHLADTLASRLESLSGYQAVYPPGDPSAALNPIVHSHVRLTVAGKVLDVLSRIGPAGLDYSGRPNKYAHHIVLDDDDRPEGGPAWLLSQPGFLQAAWQGEPRVLPAGKTVPHGDRPASIAATWQALAGDAGWAGVLAESFLTDPRRPAFLIFRPGMEILPLFVEAIALLPAPRRWEVEFSTYFNTLPQGVTCAWRGVLDGSAEAKNARRLPNALIVDLCRPIGRASGDDLVQLARTGEHRDRPAEESHRSSHAEPGRVAYPTAGPPLRHDGTTPRVPRPDSQDSFDVLPDLAARLVSDLSLSDREPRRRQPRQRKRLVASVSACLLLFLMAGVFWALSRETRVGSEPKNAPSQGALAQTPGPDHQPPLGKAGADPRPLSPPYEGGGRGGASTSPDPTINQPIKEQHTTVAEKDNPKPGPPTSPAAAKSAGKSSYHAPEAPGPREPLILACALPEIPKSQFGNQVAQQRVIDLPEDADDRFEVLNAKELRSTPAGAFDLENRDQYRQRRRGQRHARTTRQAQRPLVAIRLDQGGPQPIHPGRGAPRRRDEIPGRRRTRHFRPAPRG